MIRFCIPIFYRKGAMLILLVSVCISLIGQSQIDHPFISSGPEIIVDVLPGNDIIYSHPYSKGISIYSLAEVFHTKVDIIFAFNQMNPTQPINEGKIVKIPLLKEEIITEKQKLHKLKKYLPIFYQIKKGETIYRISKQFFGVDQKTLISQNHKEDNNIQVGEILLVGWWAIPDKRLAKNQTIEKVAKPTLTPIDQQKPDISPKIDNIDSKEEAPQIIKYYISDAVGWWEKSVVSSKNYFVLHNDAKVGSMLDIYNPMMKNHVKAKVIGKIPTSTYSEDIQIIISPAVAKDLGILDTRFMVNIKYER